MSGRWPLHSDSRSISILPATASSPSDQPNCWEYISRTISTGHILPHRHANSGEDGTSLCRPGSAIISTFHFAAFGFTIARRVDWILIREEPWLLVHLWRYSLPGL